MNKKENDMMLNMVANPSFRMEDFAAVGLNADNTSLLDASYYKNNPFILKKFTKDDGRFDEKEFTQFYNAALIAYADMSGKLHNENMHRQFKYYATNIFAEPELKNYNVYKNVVVANPTKLSYGVVGWKEQGKKLLSDDELALKNGVLLNPVEAAKDPSKARWGKDPHNGFFDYFFDPLVMAQWDSDGTHIDPITGEEVKHTKGEYKIGPDGSYYYEKLDGRDIYDKKVLNKMNVLTEEGTTLNKIDFLDSDDLHKSIGGTIMKNLALVGTMFIPGVGPWVTGLSLVPTLTGLMGTLGKMATGSDNSFLSSLEGFGKSWELLGNVSEESLKSVWNLENFINLVGDTMSLLKLLRFFFQYAPALFKGKLAGTKKATEKLKSSLEAESKAFYDLKLLNLLREINQLPESWRKMIDLTQSKDRIVTLDSLAKLDSYTKSYNKIGEVLSKGYMTAITVSDTYGEAKAAGASDLEATLLTLGYGAAEALLLNTSIGEWILPELHSNRALNRMIVKKLMESLNSKVAPEAEKLASIKTLKEAWKADRSDRRKWALNVINTARDFFKGEFFTGGSKAKNIATATLAGGLGEGVEEVSEEVLADVSKGLFNTAQWISGDDTRLNSFGYSWKNGLREWSGLDIIDRYGMSFFGGLIGGGLTNIGTAYNINKNLASMTTREAYLLVVYAARNNLLDDIRKTLDKYNPDTNDYLAVTPTRDSNGNINYVASGSNSQTVAAKDMVNRIFDFVEDTLDASKSNLTDTLFLDKLVLDLWRYQSLYNSQTAVDFLTDFNKLNVDLVLETARLEDLEKQLADRNGDGTLTDDEKREARKNKPDAKLLLEINDLKKVVKDIQLRVTDYIEGKYSVEFMSRAFAEMTPFLSIELGMVPFPIFVELKFGKAYNSMSDEEKTKAEQEFEAYKKNPTTRDNFKYSVDLLLKLNQLFSPHLPGLVANVDTPEYLRARAIFSLMINGKNVDIDDENLFLNAAKIRTLNLQLVAILKLMDNNLYLSLFNPTKQLLDNLKSVFDTDLNDIDARHQSIIDLKKQDLLVELDLEQTNYNNLVLQNNDLYDLLIVDLDKAISDLLDEINNHTSKRRAAGDSHDLFIIANTPRLLLMQSSRDSDVLNINNSRLTKLELLKNNYDTVVEGLLLKHNNELQLLENNKISEKNSRISTYNNEYDNTVLKYNDDVIKTVLSNLLNFLLPIVDKGYLDSSLRNELNNLFTNLEFPVLDMVNNGTLNPDEFTKLIDLKKQILGELVNGLMVGGMPESKIEGILNLFSLLANGTPFNFTLLVDKIYNQLSKVSAVTDIKALEDVEEAISNAKILLNTLKAVVKSAMTDNISIAQGNPFGYNAILNAVSEKLGTPLNLALITLSEGIPLLNLLNEMSNKLTYIERIYEINKGNKFSQLDRANIALILTRYEALKRFIDKGDSNPLKRWDGWNELEVDLRAIIDKTTPLKEQNSKDVEEDRAKVEDALYEFAEKNRDKLSDVNEVAKFLDTFDLTDNHKSLIMNENLTRINDLLLVQYMLSCFAIKSSDFYYKIANTDFGGIAPIPLLVEAARMAFANIMNHSIFKTFTDAVKVSVKLKLDRMDSATFAQLLANNLGSEPTNSTILKISNIANKSIWYGALALPLFSAISLVEGIAGSGKTAAVFKIIDSLVLSVPELSNKTKYFVHGAKKDKASIQSLADTLLGIGATKAFTREELLNNCIVNFKDLELQQDGSLLPVAGTVQWSNEGKLESTQAIKQATEQPSIIYIDEISLFSEFDLQSLNKWAEANNTIIIAAGDFHLNCILASFNLVLPDNLNTIPYIVKADNRHFIASPKIGLTMRSGNSVKTNNQLKVEAHLTESIDNFKEEVLLEWTKQGDMLFGDYYTIALPDALALIRAMVNTLDTSNNERITYIYDNEQSPLYLALKADVNIWNKLDPRKGNQALGDETRYSIVDLHEDYHGNLETAWQYVYTGMTRASQATVIMSNPRLGNSNGLSSSTVNIKSTRIDSMYSERGYVEYLLSWTKTRLDLLKSIFASGGLIIYNPWNTTIPPVPLPLPGPTPQPSSLSGPQGLLPTPSPLRLLSAPLSNPFNNPKYNIGEKIALTTNPNYAYKIVNYDNNTGLYVLESPDRSIITYSEDLLTPYIPQLTSIQLTCQEFANKYDYELLDITEIDNTGNQQSQSSLFNSLSNVSLNPDILNSYPYIGIDSIKDLFRLLEGDTSLLKVETDITKPHLIYLFGDGLINSISDIKYLTTLDSLSDLILDFFNNKNYPILCYNNDDFANVLAGLELARAQLYFDSKGYDFIDDEYGEKVIDTINEEEPRDPIEFEGNYLLDEYLDSMGFDISFHSVNTLELGAIPVGENSFEYDLLGIYTDANGVLYPRIDGVNGLRLMLQLGYIRRDYLQNDINSRNRSNCLNTIAYLLNILLTTTSKSEMANIIADLFGLDSSDIFINFGIRKTPTRNSIKDAISKGKKEPASGTQNHKDIREISYEVKNGIEGEGELPSNLLVALIGNHNYGECLEIPLLSIGNPITIINYKNSQGNYIFLKALEILLQYKSEGRPASEALYKILESSEIDSTLKDLCRLYLSNLNFLFRIGRCEYINGKFQHVWDNTRNWIPATALANMGLQFTQLKGKFLYDTLQLVYDTIHTSPLKWMDFLEFTQDPRFTYSRIFQVASETGTLELSSGLYCRVQPGHNFIIVSLDPNIDANDSREVLLQYILQLLPDYTGPKTLKLIYVIPPTASLLEYRQFLELSLNKLSKTLDYKIGFRDSAYKLLSFILKDPVLGQEFLNRSVRILSGLVKTSDLLNIITELDKAYNEYISAPSVERETKLKIYKELFNRLFSSTNPKTVNDVLIDIFTNAATAVDSDGNSIIDLLFINKIQEALNIKNQQLEALGLKLFLLFYTTRPSDNSGDVFFGAKVIKGVNNGAYLIDGLLKSFKVHGKLIPFTFIGKIPGFNILIQKVRLNSEESNNNVAGYLVKPLEETPILLPPLSQDPGLAIIEEALNEINNVLRGTGVTYTVEPNLNKLIILDKFITDINNTLDYNFIVYKTSDGKIHRTLANDFLRGKSVGLERMNLDLNYINTGDTFTLVIYNSESNEEKRYNASFDGQKITYEDEIEIIVNSESNINESVQNINNNISNVTLFIIDNFVDEDGTYDIDFMDYEDIDWNNLDIESLKLSSSERLTALQALNLSTERDLLIAFEEALLKDEDSKEKCKIKRTL